MSSMMECASCLIFLLLLLSRCTALSQKLKVQLDKLSEDHGVHCSRERSRRAWKVIDEYLLPFVERERYDLPTSCRLHPDNDMFRRQERDKERLTAHQWQCVYCDKTFRSEEYLDQHFNRRHHDKLNVSRDRCLADICGALHCDYVASLSESKFKKAKCNPAVADKNRHLCESLANSCFPPNESVKARRLNDFFLRQICDSHSCQKGVKYFPRGSGKSGNVAFYLSLSLFTFLLLLLFYGGMYIHKREMSKNIQELKRISHKATTKLQKSKAF